MKAIDIVMTTWKREPITMLSLTALTQNTDFPFRIILIDNGSDPYSQLVYKNIVDVYEKLPENMGLEYAKNYAMKFVKSEYFISTDNDIIVPKRFQSDWLTRLYVLMLENKDYGAIALRPQVLVGTGDIFGEHPQSVTEFSHVPGYMRIMNTKTVNELGAWSDKRPLRGHEEYWISDKLHSVGKKTGFASHIKCWHMFGEDNWGYKGMTAEETGHNPVDLPKDDFDVIESMIDIVT